METYTIQAAHDQESNDFYNHVLADVVRDFFATFSPEHCSALILKGAPARGDATVVAMDSKRFSMSDIEFLVVLPDTPTPDFVRNVRRWEQKVNRSFADVVAGIDVVPISKNNLPGLHHTISTYETSLSPTVIWGDRTTAKLLPRFTIQDITLQDCLTYFHNRVLEEFLIFKALDTFPKTEEQQGMLLYKTGKLILDLATTFLYAERNAPLSYASRAKHFTRIISDPGYRFFSSIRESFIHRMELWLELKTTGNLDVIFDFYNMAHDPKAYQSLVTALWYETIDWIAPFWKHFFQRMGCNVKTSTTWQGVADLYFSFESLQRKMARWFKIRNHPNVDKKWFPPGRMIPLLFTASPRYLVYRTAVLAYLSCSPDFASDELQKTISRYFPMRLPKGFSTLPEKERLLYLAQSLDLFYRAVILNRLIDEKATVAG